MNKLALICSLIVLWLAAALPAAAQAPYTTWAWGPRGGRWLI